jgi:hypothetical protein
MKVTLKGWPELERALAEELPKATSRNVLTRALKEAAQPMVGKMASLAPYDPADRDEDGKHLRDTIRAQPAKAKLARKSGLPRDAGVMMLVGPGPTGRRARSNAFWQENGTVKQAAQPYVRPAADSEGAATVGRLKDALAEQIEKAKQRIARKAARGS